MKKVKLPINHLLLSVCIALLAPAALAQQVFKTTPTSVIGYLEYVPQDYNTNSNKYPIVIFLHGLGERGPNSTDPATLQAGISVVNRHGPPMYANSGTQFPFILISPQLKNNYGDWPSAYVMEVINYCKTYLRIDEKRIYITGLSLGGGGTWWLSQDYPKLFAAAAPVCGSRNSTSKACLLAGENLPVWAFHGDADTTVPLSRSVNMVNAINACTPAPNPLAKITIYPGVNHNSWDKAYTTDHSVQSPNVYEWMLSYTNTINAGNKIPVANAGTDVTKTTSSVSLTGSGTDADGTISTYAWSQLTGPSVATLTNASSATVTASGLVAGSYVFKLQVTDNSGNTDSDYIKVTIQTGNSAPVANAGADQTITLPTSTATINGTGTDTDGTIASYLWTKVSGGAATLSGANTSKLVASGLVAGTYQFSLKVTDDKGATATDNVIVTVNIAPTANAGADQTITLPINSLTLNGAGTDSDGTIASYAWTKVSGGTATLTGANTSKLVASGLVEGTYQFSLKVTDNKGASATDNVIVTVNATANKNAPPIVDAGADAVLKMPATSAFYTGTATDSDGTIASYLWTQVSGPPVKLSDYTTSRVKLSQFTAASGTIVLRLTVTDNGGATTSDDRNIFLDYPPVVDAGADITVQLPVTSITLKGTVTDQDGTIVNYKWLVKSGPSCKVTNGTTPTPTITALQAGVYSFRFSALDNLGLETVDYVTVTVLAPATSTAAAASARAATTVVAAGESKDDTFITDEETAPESGIDLSNTSSSFWNNKMVVVYNESGSRIYAGPWSEDTYHQLFQAEGLYLYQVNAGGRRIDTGKIYVKP
jgi:dienelactone hydrolase